jgi:hypothetical protein
MNPFGYLGIGYRYGSLSYNNVTFNGGSYVVGSDGNSVNASVYSNKSDQSNNYQIAYEQDNYTKSIDYCKVSISPTWVVSQSTVSNISSGDGYYNNYQPSIVGMPDGTARVCWLGDYYGDGSDINAMYRNLNNNTFYDLGYNSKSTSINVGTDNSCYMGWSTNWGGTSYSDFIVDVSSPYNSKTLNTSGKDIQLCNGASKSSMFVSSFYPFTAPYYFLTSNSLSSFLKVNSNAISSGKSIVVVKGGTQFSFTLGDLSADNQKIQFMQGADTLINKSNNTSSYILYTNPFTIKDNSDVEFSSMTGVIDTSKGSSLPDNNYIEYKVELIDNSTGEVLGTLTSTKTNSANSLSDSTLNYKLNTDGLGGKTVKAALVVNTNIPNPGIYYVERYLSGSSVVNKSSSEAKEITVQGNALVKNYSMDQNYPNPFNPANLIHYEMPKDGFVTLKVYDVLGNLVKTLVNQYQAKGRYDINFNADNLASGVYLYRLQSGNFISTKKMLLLK